MRATGLTDADYAAMNGFHIFYFAPTWGAGEPTTRVIPVPGIKLRKSKDVTWTPCYEVGTTIGRVIKADHSVHKGQWEAFISNNAYYPADADILTRCKQHREHRGESGLHLEPAEITSTRLDAVNAILSRLGQRNAEDVRKIIADARRPWIQEQAAKGERWAMDAITEGAAL